MAGRRGRLAVAPHEHEHRHLGKGLIGYSQHVTDLVADRWAVAGLLLEADVDWVRL
jgi:hypothetical protein